MNDIEIVDTNAKNISACSFCGYKNPTNKGHRGKTNWLKKQYADGLRFKVLHSPNFGDLGMIEYAPGSHTWRPVEADGYFVIHCLMVNSNHKNKGFGTLLLNSCLSDAKQNKCLGVAVVTSSGSFMAESALFKKAGFDTVESIPPYELLVKKLKKSAPAPRFNVNTERALKQYSKGLTILAAGQCPMVPKCVDDITQAAKDMGLKPKVVQINSAKESRELPTPYGIFSIIYNGKIITEHPISATRFKNIMNQ